MICTSARNAFLLPYTRNLALCLPVFLTLCLTNCAKTKRSDGDTIFTLPTDDDFPADDVSKLPLSLNDLENLANLNEQFFVIETAPALLKNTANKRAGKVVVAYTLNPVTKTFTYTSTTNEKLMEGLNGPDRVHTRVRKTFSTEEPFLLQSEELTYSSYKKDKSQIAEITRALDCTVDPCILSGSGAPPAKILRGTIRRPSLREFLIREVVAETKASLKEINIDRVNIKYDTLHVMDDLNLAIPPRVVLFSLKQIFMFKQRANQTIVTQFEQGPKTIKKISHAPFVIEQKNIKKTIQTFGRLGEIKKIQEASKTILPENKDVVLSLSVDEMHSPQMRIEQMKLSGNKAQFVVAVIRGDVDNIKSKENQELIKEDGFSIVNLTGPQLEKDKTADPTKYLSTKFSKKLNPKWIEELRTPMATATDLPQKAYILNEFAQRHIEYAIVDGTLNDEEISELKLGDCSEMAKLVVMLAREFGIPARLKLGYLFDPADFAQDIALYGHPAARAHAWPELYGTTSVGEGWTYVDPTRSGFEKMKFQGPPKERDILFDLGESPNLNADFEDYSFLEKSLIYFAFDKDSLDKLINRIKDEIHPPIRVN
jgi:hypothetical protein